LVGKPEGKRPLEDLGIDGNILECILTEIGWEVVDWTCMAQDRVQWWAVVNTVMNLLTSYDY
jgi:hypothetical protein